MVTAIPTLNMIPVRWPLRTPCSGRRSSSAAEPTTTVVPTAIPCSARATSRAATSRAAMNTARPTIIATIAPTSSGLRPNRSETLPATSTATSAPKA